MEKLMNQELSTKALYDFFTTEGSMFNFERVSSSNQDQYREVLNHITGGSVILTFDESDRLGITKEKLDYSFVDLGVGRWLATYHMLHLMNDFAIRFCSNDQTRVQLFVKKERLE
jgi:hypothetical protein